MTFNQYVKDRIKDDPEWQPTSVKKVAPSVKSLRKKLNLDFKLRGRGWTRPWKNTPKKKRKMSQASRKINRQ
jgi:hypothetical protein